jgi:hypothetical protein
VRKECGYYWFFALSPGIVKFITKPGKEIKACMFSKKKTQQKS